MTFDEAMSHFKLEESQIQYRIVEFLDGTFQAQSSPPILDNFRHFGVSKQERRWSDVGKRKASIDSARAVIAHAAIKKVHSV